MASLRADTAIFRLFFIQFFVFGKWNGRFSLWKNEEEMVYLVISIALTTTIIPLNGIDAIYPGIRQLCDLSNDKRNIAFAHPVHIFRIQIYKLLLVDRTIFGKTKRSSNEIYKVGAIRCEGRYLQTNFVWTSWLEMTPLAAHVTHHPLRWLWAIMYAMAALVTVYTT